MAATVQPLLLAGPTACGKSEVALRVAERIGGEIISVDSMQVYRGLDIGTAKPAAADRARVPHHLVDVVELTEAFDAAKFVARAREAIRAIQAHDRVPILCGGTGLYFKALTAGLGSAPPADAQLREQLEALPSEVLLQELATKDLVTFAQIDRENFRRIVRAVEVLRLTNRPFSEQRAGWKSGIAGAEETAFPSFGLTRQPEDLKARIDQRVEAMFAAGLVEETRRLLEHGLAGNRTAMQALGYRQVAAHLRGELALDATVDLVKVRTRQFAKRQLTWFRRQLKLQWLEVAADEFSERTAERILAAATAPKAE